MDLVFDFLIKRWMEILFECFINKGLMQISKDHLLLFLLMLPSKSPTREDPSLDLQRDPNRRRVSGHTRGSGEKAIEACHKLYISLKTFLFRSCATYILIHNMFILKNLKYYCKCFFTFVQSSGINHKCQENILNLWGKFLFLAWHSPLYLETQALPSFFSQRQSLINLGN